MNRLVGNAWQTPVQVSWPTTRIDIPVGPETIRMAYGFAFDVGAPSYVVSENGERIKYFNDANRLLYTTRDSTTKRLYVRGTGCARDLTACDDVPQMGAHSGQFEYSRASVEPDRQSLARVHRPSSDLEGNIPDDR